MSNDPNPESDPAPDVPPAQGAETSPTYDDIALRAYFIALRRHAEGGSGDPLQDWIEAERQFREQ